MASLCNPVEDESFKHPNFFTVKTAQGRRDGLLRNKEGTYAELFDPWGNPYHVLLDYDFDRKLTDPHTYEDRVGHNAIIWSPGPDGKTGTPSSNKDDIR